MDDAIRAGVLAPDDLPPSVVRVLGDTHSRRINTLVADLVATSTGTDHVRLSPEAFRGLDELRDFMFERVYLRPELLQEQAKAEGCIRALFAHYLDHPEDLPEEYHRVPGDIPTSIADHIAGMTDRYALRTYEQLFLPQGWLM